MIVYAFQVHNDPYDNINCVFAGSKRFYIVDPVYFSIIQDPRCGFVDTASEMRAAGSTLDGLTDTKKRKRFGYGQFAREINVSQVDLVRFPCWANLPWREAVVEAGDCLFLPQWHYHHVHSTAGPGGLNAAINMWWKRLDTFDASDGIECSEGSGGDDVSVSVAEIYRQGNLNPGMY